MKYLFNKSVISVLKTSFYIIIFAFIFLLNSCYKPKQTHPELVGLETEIDSIFKTYHTVGAAVGIIKDGELIYANGFGYRDLEKQTLATPQTVFGIGSCTKAFTAALFGILEEEGSVSFNENPKLYIPELSFYTPEMDTTITLHHILSHSTGIPNLPTESSAVFFRSEDKNVIIPRLKHLAPAAAVGTEWRYNNYIYALAGRITERITGESWQENLQQYIFSPLHMQHTYGNVGPASKDSNFALGYGVRRSDTLPMQVLPENFPTRDAGGNIYSTVSDMAKWLQVWMKEGTYEGQSFLSKEYITKATGNQQLMSTDTVTQTSRYYGYGWMNEIQDGHRKIEHSGGISGYSSNVAYYPDDQLGIIVLTNQNTAGTAFAITNTIAERFLNIEIPVPPNEPYFSTVVTLEDPNTPTIVNVESPPSHDLSEFVGNYFHPGFGSIEVTFDGQTLYADMPFTKFRLSHHENNVFYDHFTERKSQVVGNFLQFDFQIDEASQRVSGILLNIAENGVTFKRH